MKTFNLIGTRNYWFIASGFLFVVAVVLLATLGLRPGIDFTGGSLIEVRFTGERPTVEAMQTALSGTLVGSVTMQSTADNGYLMRMRYISEDEHQQVISVLRKTFHTGEDTPVVIEGSDNGSVEIISAETDNDGVVEEQTTPANRVIEERVETIGPAISETLRTRSIEAIIGVVIAIVLFIAYAFRKVSKPVASWKYGVVAVVALLHDIIITMGIFVFLGWWKGVEIDIPFVVALLTILGYSVNDTIIVFDRVREMLIKRGSSKFAETVNLGLNQTLARSMNTSLTTLLVLVALFLFGGDTIHNFSLALIVGIVLGAYSSIFVASPLLVVWSGQKE